MPSFTLHHPWVITALYVGIPLAFLLFVKWLHAQSYGPGDMQIGATMWTVISFIPVAIAWLVSFVVAFIRMYQFITTVPMEKYVWVSSISLLIIGIIVGVIECYFLWSDYVAEALPYFLSFTVLCLIICTVSTYGIIHTKPGLLGASVLIFIVISGLMGWAHPHIQRARRAHAWEVNKRQYDKLFEACKTGNLQTVKTWLTKNKGKDVNYIQDFQTALYLASEAGNVEVVDELLNAGADVNLAPGPAEYGWTPPIGIASENGHLEVVKLLLNSGANVGIFKAMQRGYQHPKIFQFFIDHGEDVNNTQYYFGDSSLMYFSKTGNKDIVELLLKAGADVNIKNKDGKTALMLAQENNNTAIVELLKSAGAKE